MRRHRGREGRRHRGHRTPSHFETAAHAFHCSARTKKHVDFLSDWRGFAPILPRRGTHAERPGPHGDHRQESADGRCKELRQGMSVCGQEANKSRIAERMKVTGRRARPVTRGTRQKARRNHCFDPPSSTCWAEKRKQSLANLTRLETNRGQRKDKRRTLRSTEGSIHRNHEQGNLQCRGSERKWDEEGKRRERRAEKNDSVGQFRNPRKHDRKGRGEVKCGIGERHDKWATKRRTPSTREGKENR